MAMYRLWLLDYIDAYPPIDIPEEPEEEEEDPKLTKLGRPVLETRLTHIALPNSRHFAFSNTFNFILEPLS
jgi:hypothetical protein